MIYRTPERFRAFSVGKDKDFPLCDDGSFLPPSGSWGVSLPRQVHSSNVAYVTEAGRPSDTDAVFTDVPGLCVAVKTADCIPILLYANQEHPVVAAVHAGWRGTVSRIVCRTLEEMKTRRLVSSIADCCALIGPGISQASFEVGDEVYETFAREGFPMKHIAQRQEKWHLDLREANRWLLQECGVCDIFVSDVDTKMSPDWYSARRETINTGRNYNAIFFLPS